MSQIVQLPGLDPYSIGSNAGDAVRNLADAAGSAACGFYRTHPKWVVNDPNGFGGGLMDNLCRNRGGSPPPPKQPQGGQCEGVLYWWNLSTGLNPRIIGPNGENAFAQGQGPFKMNVYGVINEETIDGVKYQDFGVTVTDGNGISGNYSAVGTEGDSPTLVTRRVDNQPDVCGNGPADYPPDQTIEPPAGNPSFDIDLPGPGGPGGGISFKVPLIFVKPELNVNLNPKITLQIGPNQFNLEGKVTFDFSGARIQIGPEEPPGSLPPPSGDSTAIDQINRKVDDLRRKIDDLADAVDDIDGGGGGSPPKPPAAPPPEADPDIEPPEEEPPEKTQDKFVERLYAVRITLTKLPTKGIYGEGSPDVHFGGWFEWLSGNDALPREQITFQRSLFLAPPGADGYGFCLTNGAEGFATVFKRKVPVGTGG